jgi:hypothetical protein
MVAMGHEARTRDAAAPFDPCDRHSHEEFVPDEIAALLHTTVAAAAHTAPQTRRWLARCVIETAPEAAERRRRAAVEERRVVVTPRDDGTAELWALLPRAAARQIQQTLTAMAHQSRSGLTRTMDQLRADVLVDVLLGAQAPSVQPMPVLILVDTTGVPIGATLSAAELPGWGPLTPGELDEVLCGAVPEPRYRPSSAVDAAVRLRDQTCRFPGCRGSALGTHSGTDLDHTVPWPAGASRSPRTARCGGPHRSERGTSPDPGWPTTALRRADRREPLPSPCPPPRRHHRRCCGTVIRGPRRGA